MSLFRRFSTLGGPSLTAAPVTSETTLDEAGAAVSALSDVIVAPAPTPAAIPGLFQRLGNQSPSSPPVSSLEQAGGLFSRFRPLPVTSLSAAAPEKVAAQPTGQAPMSLFRRFASAPQVQGSLPVTQVKEARVTLRVVPPKTRGTKGVMVRRFWMEHGRILGDGRIEQDDALVQATLAGPDQIATGWFEADGRWVDGTHRGKAQRRFEVKRAIFTLPDTFEGAVKIVHDAALDAGMRMRRVRVEEWLRKVGKAGFDQAVRRPELLIAGLGPMNERWADRLRECWRMATGRAIAQIDLSAVGIEQSLINKVITAFREMAGETIRHDPYRLMEFGASFATADKVAFSLGFSETDDIRIRGYLYSLLLKTEAAGSTAVPIPILAARAAEEGGVVDADAIAAFLERESDLPSHHDGYAVTVTDAGGEPVCALSETYRFERDVAEHVVNMLRRPKPRGITREQVVAIMKGAMPDKTIDPIQVEAVLMAATHPLSILTGGPGTGKSTVSKGVLEVIKHLSPGTQFIIAAPTGKASRRLSETTGMTADTLHKHLGAKPNPNGRGSVFDRDRSNPLPDCFALPDEASMIDIELGSAFLRSLSPRSATCLVGDENQLTPVGAGQLLADLLAACHADGSPIVPRTVLTKVFRQDESGGIATGAADIRNGRVPDMPRVDEVGLVVEGGRGLVECRSGGISSRIQRLIPGLREIGLDPLQDMMVLCPQGPGIGGTFEINAALSAYFNPDGKPITDQQSRRDGMPIPKVGDRVMFTENTKDGQIRNGDVGIIQEAGRRGIIVAYDGIGLYTHKAAEWFKIITAYACTVHKSQGSQYPIVLLSSTDAANPKMLERRLFYTGWTRASDRTIVVGSPAAMRQAIENYDPGQRYTLTQALIEERMAQALKAQPRSTEVCMQPFTSASAMRAVPPQARSRRGINPVF